jgi:hypothetical protein
MPRDPADAHGAPISVGDLSRSSQVEDRVRKVSKSPWDEPVKGESRRVATSRLSRQTQRSVAKHAVTDCIAALIPARAASASASKTSLFGPRGKDDWVQSLPVWYRANPAPAIPSGSFDPSVKTFISLLGREM